MREGDALAQVWGKGFRITQRSEEFQLLVPNKEEDLDDHERRFGDVEWGPVLRSLYRLDDATCERQFYLHLGARAVTYLAVAPTKDRNDRQSVVAVASSAFIQWERDDLGALLAHLAALSRRLVTDAQLRLRGAPDGVRAELREGSFYGERTFPLEHEPLDKSVDWPAIAREVSRFRGVKAISTPFLALLGANVLVGTRHEGERLPDMAGVIEPPVWEMIQLSDGIEPWKAVEVAHAKPEEEKTEREHLAEINETLRDIRKEAREHSYEQRRQTTLFEDFYDLFTGWLDFVMGKSKKRK